jgi:hypothetical protein
MELMILLLQHREIAVRPKRPDPELPRMIQQHLDGGLAD